MRIKPKYFIAWATFAQAMLFIERNEVFKCSDLLAAGKKGNLKGAGYHNRKAYNEAIRILKSRGL